MYRTPSQNREYPTHAKSVISGAGSAYGSFKSVRPVNNSRDQVIHQLRKELAELKQGYKDLGPVTHRLSNVEHKYHLLNENKSEVEEKFKEKDNMYQNVIALHEDDVHELQKRVERKAADIVELKSAFTALEKSVHRSETDIAHLENRLREEVEAYERLVDEKTDLEAHSSHQQREVIELRNKLQLIHDDIDKMQGQISKQARIGKELKSTSDNLDLEMTNKKRNLYSLEAEIKNLKTRQSMKDKELHKKTEKAEMIEGETSILRGESNKLDQDIESADETLRMLCEERADLKRKLESLVGDKDNQYVATNEVSVSIDAERKLLNEEETRNLSLQAEKRSLITIVEKMRAEARKAAKAIEAISDGRDTVRSALNREERVRALLDNASNDINYVLRIACE